MLWLGRKAMKYASPLKHLTEKQLAEYQEVFKVFDRDGDGYVNFTDLQKVCALLS
jgi:Ca2+-binding EF-hand superfamily protein